MAKDPAFLFYPGDWLGGTLLFSRHHKGAYMDLLMAQYNNGHMTLQQIKTLLGEKDEHLWEDIFVGQPKPKFIQDSNGLWYNEKLEYEINRRKSFTDSRRRNLEKTPSPPAPHMGSHMGGLMENENENVIKDELKEKEESEKKEEPKIKIDYKFIAGIYHSSCPKMNKVVAINDLRKGFMNGRVGEYGMETVVKVFRLAGESSYLCGQNEKAWKADFEWILRPTNFLKILEGKYTGGTMGTGYKTYTYNEMLVLLDRSGGDKRLWSHYEQIPGVNGKPLFVHQDDVDKFNIQIKRKQKL